MAYLDPGYLQMKNAAVIYFDKDKQRFWFNDADWSVSANRITTRRAVTNTVSYQDIISAKISTAVDQTVLIGKRTESAKYATTNNTLIRETITLYLTGALVGDDEGDLSYGSPVTARYNQKLSAAMNSANVDPTRRSRNQ